MYTLLLTKAADNTSTASLISSGDIPTILVIPIGYRAVALFILESNAYHRLDAFVTGSILT